MNEWMNRWMNGWVNEQMNEWMNRWMNGWVTEWMNEWMNRWHSDVLHSSTHETSVMIHFPNMKWNIDLKRLSDSREPWMKVSTATQVLQEKSLPECIACTRTTLRLLFIKHINWPNGPKICWYLKSINQMIWSDHHRPNVSSVLHVSVTFIGVPAYKVSWRLRGDQETHFDGSDEKQLKRENFPGCIISAGEVETKTPRAERQCHTALGRRVMDAFRHPPPSLSSSTDEDICQCVCVCVCVWGRS